MQKNEPVSTSKTTETTEQNSECAKMQLSFRLDELARVIRRWTEKRNNEAKFFTGKKLSMRRSVCDAQEGSWPLVSLWRVWIMKITRNKMERPWSPSALLAASASLAGKRVDVPRKRFCLGLSDWSEENLMEKQRLAFQPQLFLWSAPVAFRRVALETPEWTSRDSNHHRQSVSAGKTNAIPTEPSGRLLRSNHRAHFLIDNCFETRENSKWNTTVPSQNDKEWFQQKEIVKVGHDVEISPLFTSAWSWMWRIENPEHRAWRCRWSRKLAWVANRSRMRYIRKGIALRPEMVDW